VLQVRGYARVDLRVTDQGEVHVIEVNPSPGWSATTSSRARPPERE
jgi:D-alanine-D-alanine ligase-like ATP-grasp enzyme